MENLKDKIEVQLQFKRFSKHIKKFAPFLKRLLWQMSE